MKLNWSRILHSTKVKNSYHLYNSKTNKTLMIKRSYYAKDICEVCDIPLVSCTDLDDVKAYKEEMRKDYLNFNPNNKKEGE